MISLEQTMELRKVLGVQITASVLEKLQTRGITAKKGRPYSKNMISAVYRGERNNESIESAIFDLYDEKLKEFADRNKRLGIIAE